MKNVFVKKGLWIVGLLLILGVSVAAYGFSQTEERADCPGKVECHLTGEMVCRDECPLSADSKTTKADEELPPCCRGKK